MSTAKRIVESLLDINQAKPIVYRDKVIKDGVLICPHCNAEIHEKGTYSDDGGKTMRHRECQGIVDYKSPSEVEIHGMEKHWGLHYDPATKKFTPVG